MRENVNSQIEAEKTKETIINSQRKSLENSKKRKSNELSSDSEPL